MTDHQQADPGDVHRIGGDPDAFEAFYREHLDTVQRFVARRVADPYLAADLTADVFLAAVEAAAGYRADRGNPAAWLTGVARNVVAAEFRRQGRQRTAVRKIAGRRLLETDSLGRIEERIDAERETRRLYDALAVLRPRDRALMEPGRRGGDVGHRRRSRAGGEAGHRAGPAAPQPAPGPVPLAAVDRDRSPRPGGFPMSTTRPLDHFEQSLLAEPAQPRGSPRRRPRTPPAPACRRRCGRARRGLDRGRRDRAAARPVVRGDAGGERRHRRHAHASRRRRGPGPRLGRARGRGGGRKRPRPFLPRDPRRGRCSRAEGHRDTRRARRVGPAHL
ncbi:sigma-70 family RNA polymerase sigma factor [Nocardioides convexus]|uniref:RNA polymerase sigma factor n=1 Tax=Nocardioides convexus TaxID=2712224 RepID=UPI0024186C22|nr:sigma-70 family RNA polymerase sigma factor [Nocardioides convexus]